MNVSPRFETAVEQGRDGGCAAVDSFIARWGTSSGAERANYQLFLAELCDVLGWPSTTNGRPKRSAA
jgi:hypothetical protein